MVPSFSVSCQVCQSQAPSHCVSAVAMYYMRCLWCLFSFPFLCFLFVYVNTLLHQKRQLWALITFCCAVPEVFCAFQSLALMQVNNLEVKALNYTLIVENVEASFLFLFHLKYGTHAKSCNKSTALPYSTTKCCSELLLLACILCWWTIQKHVYHWKCVNFMTLFVLLLKHIHTPSQSDATCC